VDTARIGGSRKVVGEDVPDRRRGQGGLYMSWTK
jgi:hypothetical protein